ncbi:MAG: hypothetical protein ACK4IX_05085 [Candidatus Sericytochromatia bacterium]
MSVNSKMNVAKILKSVKSEVAEFLDAKKKEKNAPKRSMVNNTMDKFVKSNSNDLMDIKAKTRYVNGICYGNNNY